MRRGIGIVALALGSILLIVAGFFIVHSVRTEAVAVSYSIDPPDDPAEVAQTKEEPVQTVPTSTAAAAPTPVDVPSSSIALDAVGNKVPIYASPSESARKIELSGFNELGQTQGFMALQKQGDWYYAQLPSYPGGSVGWIPAAAVTERVVVDHIVVRLGQYRIEHYQNGVLRQSFPVAIGKASTPTPTGKFYVMGVARDTLAHYKPIDIGLSAFSAVIKRGRTGIHGWHNPSVVGKPVSNGCIRMRPPDAAKLSPFVQIGVPVQIVK